MNEIQNALLKANVVTKDYISKFNRDQRIEYEKDTDGIEIDKEMENERKNRDNTYK